MNNPISKNKFWAFKTIQFTVLQVFFCLILTSFGFAQRPVPTPTSAAVSAGSSQQEKKVEILHADSLVGIIQDGIELRRLFGNVRLRQENVVMSCNLATVNDLTNIVEAYGKVKIVQGDTVTITGDTATYNGNLRQALMSGRSVVMNDKTMTLTTKRLDYDLNTSLAYYNTNGRIVDKENTLISKEGYYNTHTKDFLYKYNVKLVGKNQENKKPFSLTADSLRYNTNSKVAFFIAPTQIISEKDTMNARKGLYDTKNKSTFLTGRSTMRNEDYEMTGDTTFYDRQSEKGLARGNVVMVSRKDKTILYGKAGTYSGKEGLAKIWGDALMKRAEGTDSLFLSADTLISIENKEKKTRTLFAFHNVLIFKEDLQGKCDSLVYQSTDSTIYFYQKPILWSDKNQSTADSIQVMLANNKIQQMYLRSKSFVIATDSLNHFNQVKGRKVTALFGKEGKMEKVFVEGNGESIYYVLDDKNILVGMNKVECSKMNLNFDKGKVKRIAFIAKPDATLSPPKDINDEKKYLPDFVWRIQEKPTKEQTIKHAKSLTLPAVKSVPKSLTSESPQVRQIPINNKKPNTPN